MTAPGRWHWAKNAATRLPPEMSVCCCSDDKHNFHEVTPEYLDALEDERETQTHLLDEAYEQVRELEAENSALRAERDALRERVKKCEDVLRDIDRLWLVDALDAAQKEGR